MLAMLAGSNHDRIETLIPLRHSRMLESPFAFFRGSAIVQANDLAATPTSGIRVQACGDCHLMISGRTRPACPFRRRTGIGALPSPDVAFQQRPFTDFADLSDTATA